MKSTLKFSARVVGVSALVILFLLAFTAVLVHCMFGPDTDAFGRNHPIPAGLVYSLPVGENCDGAESGLSVSDSSLVGTVTLCSAGQGGMYKVETLLPTLPAGELWVECRELTEDIPLSAESIRKSTLARISSSVAGESFQSRQFTIYEGVWGEYYAARIQLWFRPGESGVAAPAEAGAGAAPASASASAGAAAPRIIAESIYRVEGWQR